ncbi:MAG: hypothetical protein ABF990_13445 [Acetobacter sp.]|uniref:hypothetical protein n=1 Tax=Acetobacter sp. TaxID=440 RepID=UPI0039E78AB3
MMENLLHGRFDVDPKTVGDEGFLRNGRVYAYWGLFPAFLRMPFLLLPQGQHFDITRLSCILATLIMFIINCKTVQYVAEHALQRTPWLKTVLFVTVAFTGVQICFLRPSLYQEVCLWSLVFAVFFVYWALRACLQAQDTPKALVWMALASVLALLTRVSMGIGLYAAESLFGLLILWRCWRDTSCPSVPLVRSWLRHCAVAVFILLAGVALTSFINFERWGNPLTFANYHIYLFNIKYPDRLPRTEQYGLFNTHRIPLGLIYFFFPVWVLRNSEGHFFFQDAFSRLIDAAELPPSSFFLTDGLFLFFSAVFVISLVQGRHYPAMARAASFAIMAGLVIPAILMLMAISMNFRYRAEFYPLILFSGFMGAIFIAQHLHDRKWIKPFSIILTVVGVISSHLVLVLYDLSEMGPAGRLLKHGVADYYLSRMGLKP